MKTLKNVFALAIMASAATFASAQVVSTPQTVEEQKPATEVTAPKAVQQPSANLTNEQLSEQYKIQLDVINSEIKTLKLQAKLYKTDPVKSAEVSAGIASKKSELSDVKAKKKIIEKAIATEKAHKKAEEKALKAQKKAEAAAAKAALVR